MAGEDLLRRASQAADDELQWDDELYDAAVRGPKPDETTPGTSLLRRAAIVAARYGGPLVGIPFGIPGAVAGGLAGETIAQALEVTAGEREELNPSSIGVSGALGLIPFAKVAPGTSLLKRAAVRATQGAGEGALASAGFAWAEDQPITAGGVALGAAAGGVLGAGAGAIEGKVAARYEASAKAKAPKPRLTRDGTFKLVDQPPEIAIKPEEIALEQGELFGTRKVDIVGGPPFFGETPANRFARARIKNLFGGALPDDYIEGLGDIVEANPALLAEQTRGVMSDRTRDALADLLVVRPGVKAPIGTAFDAPQIRALGDFAVNARNETERLLQRRRDNIVQGITDELLDRDIEQAFRVETIGITNFMGGSSEIGRAMRTIQAWKRARSGGRDLELIRRLSKQEGQTRTADEIAAALAMAENETQRFQIIRDLSKPNWQERASAYYKASLLGRVVTNTRNTVTALANFPISVVTKGLAVARDVQLVRAGLRTERTQFAGELPLMIKGIKTGLPMGFRRAVTILRKGFVEGQPTDPLAKIRAGRSSELAPGEEALTAGTKLLEPLKYSSRLLAASDDFIRTIAEEMHLHAGAYARARRSVRGLKGRAAHEAALEKMGRLLDDVPADLMDEVSRLASRATFQEEPGAIVHALYSARSVLAKQSKTAALAFDFIIPFVKTPANILRRGMINTPGVGLLTSRNEARRQAAGLSALAADRLTDTISGEAVLGTLALAPLAYLAAIGALRGDSPRDPRQRARDYEAGRVPNSLTMSNGKTVSLNLFGPAALPAAAIANAFQAYQEAKLSDRPYRLDDVVMDLMKRTGSSVLKSSFLLGLEQIMEAFTDSTTPGGQRFAKMLGQRAGSAIPFSGALQEVRNVLDPTVLDPQGFTEAALQGLPGARSVFGVTPRIETTGELATKPMVLAPFTDVTKLTEPDVVRDELDRLARAGYEAGFQAPPREQKLKVGRRDVRLNVDESLPIRQAKLRATTDALRDLMTQDDYETMDDESKARVIKRLRSRVTRMITNRARQAIATGNPLTVEDLLPEGW